MAGGETSCDRRLRAAWQFREVYRSGKSFHGTLMTLVSRGKPEEHGRVAYVASKKVGPAVRRNRAKRLLREAFRLTSADRRNAPRWRIWIARAACSRSNLREVSGEMARLLNQEER